MNGFAVGSQTAYNRRNCIIKHNNMNATHAFLKRLSTVRANCQKKTARSLVIALAAIAATGCASTHAKNPVDPLESFNRGIYQFNDTVDKAAIKPVAQGYNAAMPEPGKIMVSNFFSNLDDLLVTINDLLQFKFAQAASDGSRFLFNSTFGVFGLFDVADRLEKHDEDFGQTLGYWGMGNGPYIVLPILGPSTLRDSVGLVADSRPSVIRRVDPPRARNQLYVTKGINSRARLLDQEKILDEAAVDRYEFIRDTYLLRRKSQVYDGSPPREHYDDEYENGSNNGEQGQAPISPSLPVARMDHAPAARSADSAFPELASISKPATITPPIDIDRHSVHKVWIAQRTGIR